jgi:hypothetical protein
VVVVVVVVVVEVFEGAGVVPLTCFLNVPGPAMPQEPS